MNRYLIPALAACALSALPAAQAQSLITHSHVDIGFAYEDGAWDLHLHDETYDIEYSPPSEAVLFVSDAGKTTVPGSPSFSFLGSAGTPIWILPRNQNPALPFLGVGTEELEASDWVGAVVTLTLKAVAGPGEFAAWDSDSFGQPSVKFNTRDGLDAADHLTVLAESHAHYDWSFSAPGRYVLTFEGSGTHVVDGFVASGPVDYLVDVSFTAVPEPEHYAAVLGVGLAGFAMWRRRRTHC